MCGKGTFSQIRSHMIECNWKVSLQLQHTNNSDSLKLGYAPELVGILEQEVWGHIYSPSEAIDILLSSIFVDLYMKIIYV